MSLALKGLIRDAMVDDATMQGFFNAATTGSAAVFPVFMELSGVYPQVVYSITNGPSDPGMDSQNGSIAFNIMAQATGGVNPHVTYGDIQNRISGIFNDLSISGTAFSGTGLVSLLFLQEGGTEVTYDEQRKVYSKIVIYSYKQFGGS